MVIIIDGKNLVFRFGHVHKNLQASDGQRTGVLYGAAGLLVRLKNHFPGAQFAVCWDGEGARQRCWRKQIFPAYKNNRSAGAAYGPGVWEEAERVRKEILAQIEPLKQLFQLLHIPQIEVEGVEGDDTVAVLAFALQARNKESLIYSSDKDFCQLVHRGIKVVRDIDKSAKFGLENAVKIKQYWRCEPSEVLRLRSFTGDSSDGIPSVKPKVGIVTALKLLRAGADPAQARFERLPLPAQAAAIAVKDCWAAVHRNYRLMQLVETADDPRLTPLQQGQLQQQLSQLLSQLQEKLAANSRAVAQFLAQKELSQAFGHRQLLSQLQCAL